MSNETYTISHLSAGLCGRSSRWVLLMLSPFLSVPIACVERMHTRERARWRERKERGKEHEGQSEKNRAMSISDNALRVCACV